VSPGPLLLLVEDDLAIRRFLRAALDAHGYRVEEATTLKSAITAVTARPPDAILLDLGLPDGNGVDFIRTVRGWSQVPIVVISARDQESAKVEALDAEADDYLTKPFGVDELLARIRVALRHAARGGELSEPVFTLDDGGERLRIDLERRVVGRARPGDEFTDVPMTRTEFRLLAVLVKHAGKVLTHGLLLREVWGPIHEADVAYLRVFMRQLRQKLEPDPAEPRWLRTELGVGYRLRVPE